MAKLTPLMEQYFNLKDKYKYCILFFRVGDFYEMFYDDAILASKELEITLTGKDVGQPERAPMCGVPFHAADNYISRLVEKGYKVAICEQVEDPKFARGLVKRDVIRVVTPGTVTDSAILDEKSNNYIVCLYADKTGYGIAVCDVTTGEFQTTEFQEANALNRLIDEIGRFHPAEVICNDLFYGQENARQMEKKFRFKMGLCESWMFDLASANKCLCDHFHVHNLDGFGLRSKFLSVCASGALMKYLEETQKNHLEHILSLKLYSVGDYMTLDTTTRRNLELTETMREKSRKGTLLWVLDRTKTAMGARLLKKWIEQPLINAEEIKKRLDGVEELKNDVFLREEIKDILNCMYDFERIMGRVVYQTANCKDLIALRNSIENLPLLKNTIAKCRSPYLSEMYQALDTLEDIFQLIHQAIVDDPPFSLREGGMIKKGFHPELDELFEARENGSQWLLELENREREETGIKNLKIRENKVFGYYIEITKSNLEQVPDHYIRKQTLANCERFVTEELNSLAEKILGAQEKIVSMEYDLFCQVRSAVAQEVDRIQLTAYISSVLDVLQSLAEVAQANNYVKPDINQDGILDVENGRHPVVEAMMGEKFVSNNIYLDEEENRLSIITGPNMAGKSTYMRQTALIVLMAQVGCFVPASRAHIGIVDRIFTRVGASDDLSSGQSTFMVEMNEVANILNNATRDSLLILDEIGRGTSTFDGLSIAWAVLEYIVDQKQIGAKTLFATHYHELTELEGKLSGVKNYCITVEEQGEEIIFLRKIVRGGADHSYGVQVARLAGLPKKVIRRAGEILKKLDAADITRKAKKIAKESKELNEQESTQIDMFTMKETQLIDEINKIDVMKLTPIEAMQVLFDLQKQTKGL